MATLSLLGFAPLLPRLSRPSLAFNLQPNPSIKLRPCLPPISASSTVPSNDRLLSVFSYTTLTFRTAVPFGRFLIFRFPLLASFASYFSPVAAASRSLAIAMLVAFLAILFGLARNPNMSVYVQFNARQAMVLDLIPVLLGLFEMDVGTPSDRVGVKFVQFIYGESYTLPTIKRLAECRPFIRTVSS